MVGYETAHRLRRPRSASARAAAARRKSNPNSKPMPRLGWSLRLPRLR
ncbi:MAG: hypothetical protein J1E29_06920 [Duncaniella sp.]|nr:hypothetical protein [Duncaniella sp.]